MITNSGMSPPAPSSANRAIGVMITLRIIGKLTDAGATAVRTGVPPTRRRRADSLSLEAAVRSPQHKTYRHRQISGSTAPSRLRKRKSVERERYETKPAARLPAV